jgi:hypothetical protein
VNTALERRIAQVEAVVDELLPKPRPDDPLFLAWLTTDELTQLDHGIYWPASKEHRDLTPAEEARVMSVLLAAEARRLAGEPPYRGPYAVEREAR